VAPALLEALEHEKARYDAIALWTYLYATTQLAAPIAAGRAVLVPAAHDEPMLRFATSRGVVALADAFAFLTPEERRLVDEVQGVGDRPAEVVGAGLDPFAGDAARARRAFGLPDRFALYLGRIDAGKGVGELLAAHDAYRAGGGALGLVLAGRADGRLRLPRWAIAPGFVTEAARSDLLAAAEAVVMPSRNESLSLVLMEAWQAGRPTLATGRSDVLAGQTARSGGGLLYLSPGDYVRQMRRLQASEPLRAALGGAGAAWAVRQTWPAVAARWTALLERMRAASALSGAGSSGRAREAI
jgi:glycosyltransferase involved in cell wall biosynthesis